VLALQQQNNSHRLEREALISSLNASNGRVIAMLEKSIRTDEKFTQAMNDRPCLVRKPE
jgi:hypothetical protein